MSRMTFLHAPKNSWEHLDLVWFVATLIFLFLSLFFFFFFFLRANLFVYVLRRGVLVYGQKWEAFSWALVLKASLSIFLWGKLKFNATFQLSVLLIGKRKAITSIIVQHLVWILSVWSYKEIWIIARSLVWTNVTVHSLIKCLEIISTFSLSVSKGLAHQLCYKSSQSCKQACLFIIFLKIRRKGEKVSSCHL